MRFPNESEDALSAFVAAAPSGAVIEVAPGHYSGPLCITRPVTLRGAGELTRIDGGGASRPVHIQLDEAGVVVLDSLRLEHGAGDDGGGVLVDAGEVELNNVHIHRCEARVRGGAIAVLGGAVTAARIRTADTSANRGGALWVGREARLALSESQVGSAEASFGGALAVEDAATLLVDGLTIGRARARLSAGGQALYACGSPRGRPTIRLHRVRIESGPIGQPIVLDGDAQVWLQSGDMPRAVASVEGLVDGGANHWR